jgi:hypothetical protein
VLADASGGTIAVSFREFEQAMRASDDALRSSRDRAAETGRSGPPQLERFEVIVDTMP